jgi:hypothetical protein
MAGSSCFFRPSFFRIAAHQSFLSLFSSKRYCIRQWQFFGKSLLDQIELRIVGEICPLVRIGFMIVKFFTTVGIPNVSPTFRALCVISLAMNRQRQSLPFKIWILKQRNKAEAIKLSRIGR